MTLRERVARAVMVAVQMHEFGRRSDNGDFVCTPAQIDLLSKCCDEAADAAIALVRAEQAARIERLEKALLGMVQAVCGETGFANAVRTISKTAYPWPALDTAEAEARAALEDKS